MKTRHKNRTQPGTEYKDTTKSKGMAVFAGAFGNLWEMFLVVVGRGALGGLRQRHASSTPPEGHWYPHSPGFSAQIPVPAVQPRRLTRRALLRPQLSCALEGAWQHPSSHPPDASSSPHVVTTLNDLRHSSMSLDGHRLNTRRTYLFSALGTSRQGRLWECSEPASQV